MALKRGDCLSRAETHIWGIPKIGVPQNGWFIMENPIKMDDLGVPPFSETPIYFSLQYLKCRGLLVLRRATERKFLSFPLRTCDQIHLLGFESNFKPSSCPCSRGSCFEHVIERGICMSKSFLESRCFGVRIPMGRPGIPPACYVKQASAWVTLAI